MLVKSDSKFWQDVGSAHDQVAANHEREVSIARNGWEAKISYVDMGGVEDDVILIRVKVASTETVAPLLAP